MKDDALKIPLFFRGEPRAFDKPGEKPLNPKAFRIKSERRIFLDFKQYLSAHELNYHPIRDRIKILTDMQHQTLATRLLDWSLSPLVALFFALGSEDKDDGFVFVLDPSALREISIPDPPKADEHDINILMRALLSDRTVDEAIETLKMEFPVIPTISKAAIKKPFPFVAQYTNKRILAQQGVFTVHGDDPKKAFVFEREKSVIEKFKIPAQLKGELRKELALLRITSYTLFPDFHGMRESMDKFQTLFPAYRDL